MSGPRRLSFVQERFWFLDRLSPGDPASNVVSGRRVTGSLDRAALERALEAVMGRHAMLRTVFLEEDGVGLAHVRAAGPAPLTYRDLSSVADGAEDEVVAELARHRFDLIRDVPWRVVLLRLGPDEHVLLSVFHHIAVDGWSLSLYYRDLLDFYNAALAGAGSRPDVDAYPCADDDYADWAQRQRREVEADPAALAAWDKELADLPDLLELPADRPRPDLARRHGRCLTFDVDAELLTAVRQAAARTRTTVFMVLMAAFEVVLHRYTGQEQFAVGTPIAGRTDPATQEVIGPFINTLPVRADLRGNPTALELLHRVRERVLFVLEHGQTPFEQVAARSGNPYSLNVNPLFQVMLAFNNTPTVPRHGAGLVLTPMDLDPGISRLDLTLNVAELDGALRCDLYYSTDLFDEDRMHRFSGHLLTVLRGITDDLQRRVGAIALLTRDELAELAAWNDTRRRYPGGTLPALLAEVGGRMPEATALIDHERRISYAELARRARRWAHLLRRLGVGPDDVVGVHLQRSAELVIALHGIHAAGAAYLPLEPHLPPARIAAVVPETGTKVILTTAALRASLPALPGVIVLCVDQVDLDEEPESTVAMVSPDTLAYVIHTSGTTGTPKAIGVTHRAVVNRLHWMQEALPLTAEDRLLHKTPFSFDVSVWELFWPLFAGAALVVAAPEGHRDSAYLAETVRRHGVSVIHFVPSMLEAFLDEADHADLGALKRVVCSGEALSGALVRRTRATLPGAQLHNLYGPTEAAIDVSWYPCRAENGTTIPIGLPVANTSLTIRDGRLAELPVGVPGELYIGGIQLARGYLGRPDLTADRFIPDPDGDGARIYRTGDLARRRADGQIEFLGRTDHQVKLNGHRIEPEEIEHALMGHPAVRSAKVLLLDRPRQLTAFVVLAPGADAAEPASVEGFDVSTLAGFLAESLPHYMVPSRFAAVAELPTTANGKLDRTALGALAAPEHDSAARSRRPLRGQPELAVGEAVRALLEIELVDADDSFFALGGDSIRSLRLVSRLRTAGYAVELQDVLTAPTLGDLARRLRAVEPSAGRPPTAAFSLISPADLALLNGRNG